MKKKILDLMYHLSVGNINYEYTSEFSFQTGEIYEYDETESFFGKGYSVIHPIHGKENPTGFDENRFFEHFEIIKS